MLSSKVKIFLKYFTLNHSKSTEKGAFFILFHTTLKIMGLQGFLRGPTGIDINTVL